MNKILVTALEYDKAADFFRSVPDFQCIRVSGGETELAEAVRREKAEYVIVGVDRYVSELYEALPCGGVIARFGVGHDGIDSGKAASKGIVCVNTPGVLDDSVAECAIALMLDAARRIADCSMAVKGGMWRPVRGMELKGKNLAVIGGGHIGRKVAKIANAGLGMNVLCFDVANCECPYFSSCSQDFAAVVSSADVVSLHLPLLPSTIGFLNARRISQIRRGAILVNTARGALVDESALYDALEQRQLAAAALDVFANEPYISKVPNRDLRRLPNVVMTPHIASSTEDACLSMAKASVDGIRLVKNGNLGKASTF
ncbi:MAG: hypothetical protein IJJ33_15370 [Victivallales bacterium]|nr:hypothetical protein [Victivallales bacterium]